MNVSYSGYWSSYSGMAEAARNIMVSLHEAGVNVTAEHIQNITANADLGENYHLVKKMHSKDIEYDIKIIHITPDLITKYMEPMKYHIFHLFWETDSLPKWWVWALNLCDEIWTGSEWNKETFIRSGVKKPIWVCPQPLSIKTHPSDNFKIKDFNGFLFYSVFQWIERKDPKSLLQAYWKEFEGDDGVGLLLKTYKEKFNQSETIEIASNIMEWKRELRQSHYPKVFLFPEEMSRTDITRLHQTGDCFVLPHRGEGMGIPIMEAMVYGKPVITTNLGGINEHIPEGKVFNIKHQMTEVFNMDFAQWYSKDQKWAQADMGDLRAKMRHVFNNRSDAIRVGLSGQKWAKENLNYKTIGGKMKDRLEEISKTL